MRTVEIIIGLVMLAIIVIIGTDYKVLNENYNSALEGIRKLKSFIERRENKAKDKNIIFTVGEFRRMTAKADDEEKIIITHDQVVLPGLALPNDGLIEVEEISEDEMKKEEVVEEPAISSRLAELLFE